MYSGYGSQSRTGGYSGSGIGQTSNSMYGKSTSITAQNKPTYGSRVPTTSSYGQTKSTSNTLINKYKQDKLKEEQKTMERDSY